LPAIFERPTPVSIVVADIEALRLKPCSTGDRAECSDRSAVLARLLSLRPGTYPLANSPRNGEYLTMARRNIQDAVRRAMADTPVVLINGARGQHR